jgi:hypothetical protein
MKFFFTFTFLACFALGVNAQVVIHDYDDKHYIAINPATCFEKNAYLGASYQVYDIYKNTSFTYMFGVNFMHNYILDSTIYNAKDKGIKLGVEYRKYINVDFFYGGGVYFNYLNNSFLAVEKSAYYTEMVAYNINKQKYTAISFVGVQTSQYAKFKLECTAGLGLSSIKYNDANNTYSNEANLNKDYFGSNANAKLLHPELMLCLKVAYRLKG